MLKPVFYGTLVLSLLVGGIISASAAPLYKDTQAMAGLFPWNSHWKDSIHRSSSLGFHRGRMDLLWHMVEKRPGSYYFGFYDQVVNEMKTSGMKPIFILDYNNPAYSGSSDSMTGITTPRNREAFARFAQEAAAHFKGRDVIWEVWNEPDLSNYWSTGPDPTLYAELAQSALAGIRQGDPQAYVTTAGFGHNYWDREFIRQAMQAGMLKGFNAMAVHSYDYLNPPMVVESQESMNAQLRQWMSQYNGGVILPILDTEFGVHNNWSKKVSATPADYSAKQTIRMGLDNYYNGVYLSTVYGMDSPDDMNLSQNTPVTQALSYTNTLLGNAEGQNLNLGEKARGILFQEKPSGRKIMALWAVTTSNTVSLPSPTQVSGAVDVYGQSVSLPNGTLRNITLSPQQGPVFLILSP